MKQNPFLLALGAVGVLGILLGVVLTIIGSLGSFAPPLLVVVGGLLVPLGAAAGAGALVLAGIEWRQRN